MKLQTSLESKLKQIDVFFNPKSIAIVGASRHVNKAGNVIFSNFATNKRRGVFRGELYPINPNEDSILGFKCFPSLKKVPGDVESAVIVVPSKCVPDVMREAGVKGVSAVVIISAGFGEIGNHELEDEVMEIARDYGMRVLGPNCLGVFDSYSGVDMLFLPETKVVDTGDI
ncbi:MAG: CoA-binding protein, partial [Candidatus Bathyarchaeia archaeon]